MNRSHIVTWSLALLAGVFSLGGAGALSTGCAPSTGGDHVTFSVRGGGFEHPDTPVRFTTNSGWNVTLLTARIALGPVYLNTVAPLAHHNVIQRVSDFLVPSAWAHGESHLGLGQIVGQVTQQIEVDVLSSNTVEIPSGGDGIDLPVRSAEVWLYNREGSMGGTAIRVEGTAERDIEDRHEQVHFRGALVIDASIATPQTPIDVARRVRGIPVDFTLAHGGVLTMRVDPRTWFQGADFSELLSKNDVVNFTLADNVGRAFVNATRASRGVYDLRFSSTPIARLVRRREIAPSTLIAW
jgi:hypothetical protein